MDHRAKRVLSWLLTLVMLLSLLPMSVLAAELEPERTYVVEYADGTTKTFGLEELWAEARTHIEDEGDEVTIDGLRTTWAQYKSALALQDLTDLAEKGVIGPYDLTDEEHLPYITSLMEAMGVPAGGDALLTASEEQASGKAYPDPRKSENENWYHLRNNGYSIAPSPYDNENILFYLDNSEHAAGWNAYGNGFNFTYDPADVAYPETDGKAHVSVCFNPGSKSVNSQYDNGKYASIWVYRVKDSDSSVPAVVNYTIYHGKGGTASGTITVPAGENRASYTLYTEYQSNIDLMGDAAVITAGADTVIDRSQRANGSSGWNDYQGDVWFAFMNQNASGGGGESPLMTPKVVIPGGADRIYAPGDAVHIVLYADQGKQIVPRYNAFDYSMYDPAKGTITVSYKSTDGGTKTASVEQRYISFYGYSSIESFTLGDTHYYDTRALAFDWRLPVDYQGELKVTKFVFDESKLNHSVNMNASPTLNPKLSTNDKLSVLDMDNAYTELIEDTEGKLPEDLGDALCLVIPAGSVEWLNGEAQATGVQTNGYGYLKTVYATFGASKDRQRIYVRPAKANSEKLECLVPLPQQLFAVLHLHSNATVTNDTTDYLAANAPELPYAIHTNGGMSVAVYNNVTLGDPYEQDKDTDTDTAVYVDKTDPESPVEYYAIKDKTTDGKDVVTMNYGNVWQHYAVPTGDESAPEAKIIPNKCEEYSNAIGEQLTLTYTAEPAKADGTAFSNAEKFLWVSSDPDIATIAPSDDDPATGVITPGGTPGEVYFYLINDNSGAPVALKSAKLTVSDSPDPYLYVPATSKTVTTRQGLGVTVLFTTNLTQRNAAANPDATETEFTVSLTKDGNPVVDPLTVTGTVDKETGKVVKPASGCFIPASALSELGEYTATVTADYLGDGEFSLTNNTATIVVKPQLASIVLTPPKNDETGLPYVLDNTNPTVTWNITASGEQSEWKYEIVASDGTVVDSGSGTGSESGSYAFSEDADRLQTKLKEIYTVTVYATNDEAEDGWTAATSRVYVYNSSALDLLVQNSVHLTETAALASEEGGTTEDELHLDNRAWLSNYLNEDGTLNFGEDGMGLSFEELQKELNLSAVVSLNYGDYQWGNLSDMIRWDATHTATYGDETVLNPNGGVLYYHHPEGMYFQNGTYGTGTYFPHSEFVEQALADGKVNVTATHAATGQTTTVQLDVATLKDALYLFSFRHVKADGTFDQAATQVTYWDATDNEEHTVTSNDKGELALYEPLGIDLNRPVYLRSTEDSEKLYFGLIEPGDLISGETDAIQSETYPVNICELYRPDQVTLCIFDPNGKPLANTNLILRGGAYYDDEYQPKADVFPESEPTAAVIGDEDSSNGLEDIAVTTDGNGELHLSFNLAQVADGNVDVAKPIQYVFELRSPAEKTYRPAIVRVNPVVGRSVNVLLLSYNGSNVYLNSQGGNLNLTTASNRNTAPYINALTLHRTPQRSTALLDSIAATKESSGTRLQTYSARPDEKAEILPLSGNAGAKIGPNEQYPGTVLEYETMMRGFENLIEYDENGHATITAQELDTYTQYFYDPDTRTTLGGGYTVDHDQQVCGLWVYPFSTVPLMTTVLQLDADGFGMSEDGEPTNNTWLEKYHTTRSDVHLCRGTSNVCDLRFDYRLINSVGAMVPTESRRATGQIARLVNALEADMNSFSLEQLLNMDNKVAGFVSRQLDQIIHQIVGFSIKPYYAATVDPTVYYVYLKVDPNVYQKLLSQTLGISFVDLAKDELTKVVLDALGQESSTYDYEEMERRLGDRIQDAAKFGITPSFSDYEDLFSHVEMPLDGQGDVWDIYSFAAFMDPMAYQHEGQLLARAEYDLENEQWNMFYMDGVVNSMLQIGFGQGINVFPGIVVNIGGMAGVDKMYKAKNTYETSDIHRYDMVRQFSVGGGIELSGGLGAEAGIFSVFFGPYGTIKYTSNNATLTSTSHNEASTEVNVKTTHGNKHSLYGQAGLKFEVSAWIFSESVDLVSFNFKIKDWPDEQYKELEKLWGAKQKDLDIGVLGTSYQVVGDPDSGQLTLVRVRNTMSTRGATLAEDSSLYRQYSDKENIIISALSDDGEYVFYLDGATASWADANGKIIGKLVGTSRYNENDNKVGDFGHFYLDVSGKDENLYAVWSTQTQGFETETGTGAETTVAVSDVAAMMNSSEITVARYNGKTWDTKRLTKDNNVPDLMPKIASSGENAAVVWLSGSSSNTGSVKSVTELANFDVDNKLQFSRFNGTDWSDTQTLVNLAGIGQVTGLDTAVLSDGTAVVAYAVNLGNSEDSTGQEIYYTIVPTEGAPMTYRATENNQLDAHPQLAVVNDGTEAVLAWYTEVQTTRTVDAMNGTAGATEALASSEPSIQLLGIDASGVQDSKLPEGFSGSDDAPVTQNFRMDGDSLSGLTLAWLVNETANAGTKIEDAATYHSVLYGVQLYADEDRCVVSLPQRLLDTKENITGNDFLLSVDGKEVKAILSEADYSRGEYEAIPIETFEMEDEGASEPTPITVQIPKMYHKTESLTGAFKDTMKVSDIQYNADLVAPNTTLPITFSVVNAGVDKIESLSLNDKAQTGVVLYPGESATVRDSKAFGSVIADYSYAFTAENYDNADGVIPFSTPTVRITGMSVTAPGDKPLGNGPVSPVVSNNGNRTVTLTLENPNGKFIPFTNESGKTLTVQLFADMQGSQAISAPKTLSSSDYKQLNNGAVMVSLDTNAKMVLDAMSDESAAELELEIPETGLPVFAVAKVTEAKNVVSSAVNMTTLTLLSPADEDGKPGVTAAVDDWNQAEDSMNLLLRLDNSSLYEKKDIVARVTVYDAKNLPVAVIFAATDQLAGETTAYQALALDMPRGTEAAYVTAELVPTLPEVPKASGYTFGGWYTDAEYQEPFEVETGTDEAGNPVDLPIAVDAGKPLTVYARWTRMAAGMVSATVPVSGDSTSISVNANVSGTTATVKAPTADELNTVIGERVRTGDVVIDLSGLGRTIDAVNVPTETVKAIEQAVVAANNDADALTVKLTDGSATLDAKALAAVVEQAEGNSIQFKLVSVSQSSLRAAQRTALKDLSVETVLDIYVTSGEKRISDFKGGSATLSVKHMLKGNQSSTGIVVWYVANSGALTQIPAVFRSGEVVFTVNHFSNYVITYDALRAADCPQDDTCPINPYIDTDANAWYHDGVHWALENGVMTGWANPVASGMLFAPNGDTSRAMVAAMLWRMEGSPAVDYAMNFVDVEPGAWYTEAVRWAVSTGIITGFKVPAETAPWPMGFAPDEPVTREQFATMLYRYAQYKNRDLSVAAETASIHNYNDAATVSEWAIPAMQWSCGTGIINGIDGSLLPQDKANRAQAATMLMRYTTEN